MVRALVTGATGLIGNRIAAQLVEAGHPVRVLARGTLMFMPWNARVDATKACRELDYSPKPLADRLRRTLESFRQQRLI